MGALGWIAEHWIDLLQSVGVATSLFALAYNIRTDRVERKVETEMALVAGHRDIWSRLYDDPTLDRVLDPRADLECQPISPHEERLVLFVVLHARAAFKARAYGMTFADDKAEIDIGAFFSLPVPSAVWMEKKSLLDPAFRKFVEHARQAHVTSGPV